MLWNIGGESLDEALRGLPGDETAILVKALDRVIANLSATERRAAKHRSETHRNPGQDRSHFRRASRHQTSGGQSLPRPRLPILALADR